LQLESFLEASAQRFPDKTALVFDRRRLTYGELESRANQLAHAMIARGLDRGDRVAIWLDNSPEVVMTLFATLKAGAVFVLLNPTTKRDRAEYILNDCRARALVTDDSHARLLGAPRVRLPHLEMAWTVGRSKELGSLGMQLSSIQAVFGDETFLEPPGPRRAIDMDLAALIYTSGSTGVPKGVMMTHLNMVSATTSITAYLENTSDDIILNVLPLSFDYGLYQVLMTFKVGATLLLERSFTFPHLVLDGAVRERITGLPIVPTIAALLLQMEIGRYDLASLRYITSTAAALPTDHVRGLRERFPTVRIYSMYGLTECKRVSYLSPDQIDIRPTSVGRGMPNEHVYVVDEEGREVSPGTIGELVVRGSHVMQGYWGDPAETATRLRPGRYPWEHVLYTGDLFRTDGEGYLYFVARRDDMIKSRGEKVSPREIEDVLYGLDGVAEAAVVGVPHPMLGHAIAAYIVRRGGSRLSERNVLHHCAQRLEDFMIPTIVEFRDHLPKTTSSKIDKRAIAV
jgi:amino acid adenylation domain-containing protein